MASLKDSIKDLRTTKQKTEEPKLGKEPKTEEIPDPTLSASVAVDDSKYIAVKDEYFRLFERKGKLVADKYLASLKARGYVPSELKF